MARRYLGLSTDEWDALPWWEQKTYMEGYTWEGLLEEPNGSPGDPYEVNRQVHQGSNGTTITEIDSEQPLSHQPGEFAAQGFTETTLG